MRLPLLDENDETSIDIEQVKEMVDLYMESAVALANDMGILVCDCYQEWKKLAATQDTTKLLANHINHPIKEMHELFENQHNIIKASFYQNY